MSENGEGERTEKAFSQSNQGEERTGLAPWMVAISLLVSALLLFMAGFFYHHAALWVGILPGIILGVLFEIWNLSDPNILIKMFSWRDRTFISIFGLIVGISAFLLYFLYMLGVPMNWGFNDLYFWGIIIGGIIFGIGISIAGYFPASVWVAIGQGRKEAWWALFGGLVGAFVWTLVYGPFSLGLVKPANCGPVSVALGISNQNAIGAWFVAMIFATVFIGLWLVVPRFPSEKKGYGILFFSRSPSEGSRSPLTEEDRRRYPHMRKWVEPIVEGDTNKASRLIFILILSFAVTITAVVMLRQYFGQSITYSWLAGWPLWFTPHAAENLPYVANMFPTSANGAFEYMKVVGWAPILDLGLFLGGILSAIGITKRWMWFKRDIPPVWEKKYGSSYAKRYTAVFWGSFLVLFGARMAGGGLTGHMISGIAQLSVSGFLFSGVVFLTALIMIHVLYGKEILEN